MFDHPSPEVSRVQNAMLERLRTLHPMVRNARDRVAISFVVPVQSLDLRPLVRVVRIVRPSRKTGNVRPQQRITHRFDRY